MQILIADDNDINRQFLIGVLEETHHVTVEATDGKQAVRACRNQSFDLILMDIRMPEIDGIEATAIIRQLDGYGMDEIAIIALTADLQIQQQTNLAEHGFNDYLSKPVSRQTLLDTIENLERVMNETVTDEFLTEPELQLPIDQTQALAAAGGNRSLVEKLTEMFIAELEQFSPKIEELINTQQYDAARDIVHKIRGSAGYVGAKPIQTTCAALELCLMRNETIESRSYFQEFLKQVKMLRAFLEST